MPVMENELCRNFASRGFGPAEMGALGRGLLADGFLGELSGGVVADCIFDDDGRGLNHAHVVIGCANAGGLVLGFRGAPRVRRENTHQGPKRIRSRTGDADSS